MTFSPQFMHKGAFRERHPFCMVKPGNTIDFTAQSPL